MQIYFPMRNRALMLILFVLNSIVSFSQTTPLTPPSLLTPEITRPGAGMNGFYDEEGSGIPVANYPLASTSLPPIMFSRNVRFSWSQFEVTQGTYNWSAFDAEIANCVARHQTLTFGVQTCLPGANTGVQSGSGFMAFPLYVHTLMQGETTKDWLCPAAFTGGGGSNDMWVPNWNSSSFLTRWEAFNLALAAHINSASVSGVPIKNVIYWVELRGFGAWGEFHENNPGSGRWNGYGSIPANAIITATSLNRIVDGIANAFPNYPLVCIVNGFFIGSGYTPLATGQHLLSMTNNFGPVGWRSDHLGQEFQSYNQAYTANNNNLMPDGVTKFSTLIMSRWKTSPIGGEPMNDAASTTFNGCPMGDLINEVNNYHITSFANENLTGSSASCIFDNMRTAAAAAGAKIAPIADANSNITATLTPGSAFTISLKYQNTGSSSVYESFPVQFELRNSGGATVQTFNSGFNLKFFQPGTTTVVDNFTLSGSIATGTYSLYVSAIDALGYRQKYPFNVSGRDGTGAYLIKSGLVVSTTTFLPPTARAGSDQSLPSTATSANLNGNASVGNGGATITGYQWKPLTGPNIPTFSNATVVNPTISNLSSGNYQIQLTVTDNHGLSAADTVGITVAATAQAPVVTISPITSITLPTDSVQLNSSSTCSGCTVVKDTVTQVSGPATANIISKSAASSKIKSLSVSGDYVFRVVATADNGLTGSSTVNVHVNALTPANPVARIVQTPVSPIDSNSNITLSGTTSTAPPGAGITTYLWEKVGGATGTIITPAGSSTLINGITADGIYKLTVTDSNGNTDTAQIFVSIKKKISSGGGATSPSLKTTTAATTTMAVTIDRGTTSKGPTVITIGNVQGHNYIIKQYNYSSQVATYFITVTGLRKGTYYVSANLMNGKTICCNIFLKQ